MSSRAGRERSDADLADEYEQTVVRPGESDKAFRSPREDLTDPTERAAELAYRRGVDQGVTFACQILEGGGTAADLNVYADEVSAWRLKGWEQHFTRADLPPGPKRRSVARGASR